MKKAFTIMEVLVTITIVGIIGATIMGNIVSTKPDPKIMAFRMAYYGLQQAVTETINNPYFYDQSDLTNRLYNPKESTSTGDAMLISLGKNQMTELGNPIKGNKRATLLCRAIASYMNVSGEVSCNNTNNTSENNDRAKATTDTDIIPNATKETEEKRKDNSQNFTLLSGAKIYGLNLSNNFFSPQLDDGTSRSCPIPVIIDANGDDGPNLLYKPNATAVDKGYTSDINNVDRFRVKISPAGKVYIGYNADEENTTNISNNSDCNLFGFRSDTNPNMFTVERTILSDPSKNKATAE